MDRYMDVTRQTRWSTILILIGLCLFGAAQPAFAIFNVDKVRLYLTLNKPVDTLKVSNPSPENKPINLQAQLMDWTQKDGEEIYTPSSDLIVSPPMMRIPPNKTQLLRVGWRAPSPLQTEKAYRLYINDISPYTPLSQTGVKIKIKFGIPIFLTPVNAIYRLNWSTDSLTGNTLKLSASNAGNAHVQVINATLTAPNGSTVGSYEGGEYIFPNQAKTISFTMTATGEKNLKLSVNTDSSPMQADIRLP